MAHGSVDTQFVVFPAGPADAEALACVHVTAWRETYRGLYNVGNGLLSDTAPDWLPNTMPYAIVLLTLVFASQRLRPPAADGLPYRKGEH